MQEPLFSIIVPVYKVEAYLERCIESLVKQENINDLEIILVDDGSPDNCPIICDYYAKKYQQVVVIHKKNGGLSNARNSGIEQARGRYIAFVDSDDYVDLNAFEQVSCYTHKNVDIIVTDGNISKGKNLLCHTGVEQQKIYRGDDFLKQSVMYGSIPMAAWLYIYRREFLIENNLLFKSFILHEDEEFTPRALLKANSVIYTAVSYYHYEIREDSITTKADKRKNATDFWETCNYLLSIYNKLDDRKFKNYLNDSLVNKYLSIFQTGRLYRYGSEYLHKKFVLHNAYRSKTKIKALLYFVSPRLYWHINNLLKIIDRIMLV